MAFPLAPVGCNSHRLGVVLGQVFQDRFIGTFAENDANGRILMRLANIVIQNGEPILPSAQEQIFIPFYTTKKEGSGIGLSLARQIMRHHNGSIELLRSDALQTVFELRFR